MPYQVVGALDTSRMRESVWEKSLNSHPSTTRPSVQVPLELVPQVGRNGLEASVEWGKNRQDEYTSSRRINPGSLPNEPSTSVGRMVVLQEKGQSPAL